MQGISLCFIGAVGYAAIQESFEEAVCIKITALMANVALIAPLLGPLVGAAWVHVLPWEGMFILFAALAAIAFFGLQRAMPETATRRGETLSFKALGRDYRLVIKKPAVRRRGVSAGICQPAVVGLDCAVADYHH